MIDTKTIYRPSGQAGEYSELAINLYRGCGHKCAYCYVPNITRQSRSDFDAGSVPRVGIIGKVIADARAHGVAGTKGQVMLSFTSDPYPREHHIETRKALEAIRDFSDLGFCTLSKGGTRALRDIDLFRRDKDAYAATLTSLDDDFSRKWERGAALPADRIETLKAFHDSGIFTWVSLEPTLDCNASLAIIDEVWDFVDLFKIGRVNYIGITKTTDWEDYTRRIVARFAGTSKKHYIKRDLQPYLPPGYHNPLRVPQHH